MAFRHTNHTKRNKHSERIIVLDKIKITTCLLDVCVGTIMLNAPKPAPAVYVKTTHRNMTHYRYYHYCNYYYSCYCRHSYYYNNIIKLLYSLAVDSYLLLWRRNVCNIYHNYKTYYIKLTMCTYINVIGPNSMWFPFKILIK